MRITSIEIQNLLSFDKFHLPDLDPQLNVVVGPNGVGKTNFFRSAEMTRDALKAFDSDFRLRDVWIHASRLGSEMSGFSVRIGLELTEVWERTLLSNFMGAALVSSLVNLQGKRNLTGEVIEEGVRWIHDQLQPDSCKSLFKGWLEVAFSGTPENRWEIAYSFHHGDEQYRWLLESRDFDGIHSGTVTQQTKKMSLNPFEALIRQHGDHLEQLLSHSLDLQGLLPTSKEECVQFEVESWKGGAPIPEFYRRFGADIGIDLLRDSRYYKCGVVFHYIFQRSLLVSRDLRLPPRNRCLYQDLAIPPAEIDLADGANIPLYLYGLKNGLNTERMRYSEIVSSFQALTGQTLDLSVEHMTSEQGAEEYTTSIDLMLSHEAGDVPICFAGAGIWEALILSAFTTRSEGRVLLLDEPALNLHPPVQRRVLSRLRDISNQVFVVTHSPYLIPREHEDDLYRIFRFHLRHGATTVARLSPRDSERMPRRKLVKWMKEVTEKTDVPAMLFARAVILVEGATEAGALPIWFKQSTTGQQFGGPEDHDLALISVGGQGNFQTYIEFLNAYEVPWVVVCDGQAFQEGGIFKQAKLETREAETPTDFAATKVLGRKGGVFTLASNYDEEFEDLSFVKTLLGAAHKEVGVSKARQGRFIAQRAECPTEANDLYHNILTYLGLLPSRP